jgi:hypothetical protein
MIIINLSREGANLASRGKLQLSENAQTIIGQVAASAPPLDMNKQGMIYITRIMGSTTASPRASCWSSTAGTTVSTTAATASALRAGQQGLELRQLGQRHRRQPAVPSGNNAPSVSLMSGQLLDGEVIYVVEVFYKFNMLFQSFSFGSFTTPVHGAGLLLDDGVLTMTLHTQRGGITVMVVISLTTLLAVVGLAFSAGLATWSRPSSTRPPTPPAWPPRAHQQRRQPDRADANAKAAGQRFFYANFPANYLMSTATLNDINVTFNTSEVTITVSASATMPTALVWRLHQRPHVARRADRNQAQGPRHGGGAGYLGFVVRFGRQRAQLGADLPQPVQRRP